MTRAMERMLEVLPFGASKASGVVKALELLGLRPGDCLAMGDGMFCTNQIKSNHIPTSDLRVFFVILWQHSMISCCFRRKRLGNDPDGAG